MTRARLGFNALALQPGGTGVQTYVRELLWAIPDAVVADLLAAVRADSVDDLPPGVRPRVRPPVRGYRRFLEGARSLGSVDLVHGLDVHIPARPSAATVSTVHDLSVVDIPWSFPRQRRRGELLALRHAVRTADAVIVDSGFTGDRLRESFGRESVVVPLAPAADMVPATEEMLAKTRERFDLPPQFVLFVGLGARKDIDTLADACRIADLPLVIGGAAGPSGTVPTGTRHLGYVARSDLPALYGSATVLAYPSVYEGFGLPPLEAMACGTAVVAYDIAPLRDILGEAAVLVKPAHSGALADAIRALFADEDHRDELIVNGLAQARRYTWAATAAGTAAVYRQLGIKC
ncbi:MAG TPA: glycosyltransferase family 1 protein [Acidimicrobiales bacterium]